MYLKRYWGFNAPTALSFCWLNYLWTLRILSHNHCASSRFCTALMKKWSDREPSCKWVLLRSWRRSSITTAVNIPSNKWVKSVSRNPCRKAMFTRLKFDMIQVILGNYSWWIIVLRLRPARESSLCKLIENKLLENVVQYVRVRESIWRKDSQFKLDNLVFHSSRQFHLKACFRPLQ